MTNETNDDLPISDAINHYLEESEKGDVVEHTTQDETVLQGKKYDEKDANGDAGESLVSYSFAHLLRWPCRRQPRDLGIDAEVEVVDNAGHSTGKLIKVQVKAKKELKEVDGFISLSLEKRDITYWQLFDLPVIVCAVDLSNKKVYWYEIKPDLNTNEKTDTESMTIKIPVGNELNIGAKSALEKISSSRKAPNLLLGIAQRIIDLVTPYQNKHNTSTGMSEDWKEYKVVEIEFRHLYAVLDGLVIMYPALITEEAKGYIDRASRCGRILSDWEHTMQVANYN